MNYLKLAGIWSFLIIDLMLIVWIIELIGFKDVGRFMLSYMGSVVSSTIFFAIHGTLDPVKWKKAYTQKLSSPNKKYNNIKPLFTLIIIFGGLFSVSVFPRAYLMGFITGFLVVLYMALFCKEFLYTLKTYTDMMQDILRLKYRWMR